MIEHQIAPTNYMGLTKSRNFDILEPTSNGQTLHIIAIVIYNGTCTLDANHKYTCLKQHPC
jgi:hypothetical protein